MAAGHSPIDQFKIEKIVELSLGGYDISFTNSALWMVIAAVLASTFFLLSTRKGALLPSRWQAMSEIIYEFVAGMIDDSIGVKGRRYFSIIFTIFIVVLFGNMLGLIPHSFTYTSHIIVTGVLAFLIFGMVTVFGLLNHGLKFFTLFAPAGVHPLLLLFIFPLELLSFMIRPVTLSVRLFANMMAGHLILKVFAGFSVLALGMGGVGIVAGLVPMIFNVGIYMLEFLVAILQAYIFAILGAIYLKDSVDLHH